MVDKQEITTEKKLHGFFERLEEVMKQYSISSINELATKHLGYKSPQKLNRLKEPGANPSAEIVADIIALWPDLSANWLLIGVGEMYNTPSNKIEGPRKTTVEDILLVMAEGYKAQVETVRNIEQNMAREHTQAIMKSSLEEVRAIAEKLSIGQNKAVSRFLKEFAAIRNSLAHSGQAPPAATGMQKIEDGEAHL